MSIIQNMQELDVVKSSIKGALTDKGINMTGVPFTEYANKISEIITETEMITSIRIYTGSTGGGDANLNVDVKVDNKVIYTFNLPFQNLTGVVQDFGWFKLDYNKTSTQKYTMVANIDLKLDGTSCSSGSTMASWSYSTSVDYLLTKISEEPGEVILWTNPSPTSQFANQTITLNQSITNYNYIKVVYKAFYTSTDEYEILISKNSFTKSEYASGSNKVVIGGGIKATDGDYYGYREMTIDNSNYISVTFSQVIMGSYRNNTYVIPLKIYGINI